MATRRDYRPPAHTRAAATLVEDEPSGSGTKRRKIHVDPIVRDWFLDVTDQWRRERRWGMALCVKELHGAEQQHANTLELFIKLCWLMDKFTVCADRVVNIDETFCRLLPCIRSGGASVKQAQLQG